MADAEAQQNEEAFLTAVYRGSDLLGKKDLEGARSALREALELRPDDPKAQNLMGLVCFKLGEFEEAERLYRGLVHENPTDATLRVNLGLVCLKSGRFEEAIKELSVATDFDAGHKRAQNYLGLALARVGDYARAREHFEAAGSAQMVEQMDRALAGEDVDGGKQNGAAASDAFGAQVETDPGGEGEEEVVLEMEIDGDDVVDVAEEEPPSLDAQPEKPAPTEPSSARPVAPGNLQGSIPLAEATKSIEIGPQQHQPFSVGERVVVVGVRGEVLVRLARLVAAEGSLTLTPEVKRFRGRATDKSFGEGATRIHRASGEGRLILGRGSAFFLPVTIDGVDGYFLESAVCAFEETVSYENGRVPSSVSDDLNLVHLRGRGSVLLEAPAAIISTAVAPDRPLRVPPRYLVGWHGVITPRIVLLSDDAADGPNVAVELTGDGVALVSLPTE